MPVMPNPTVRRRATYQDVLNAPDDKIAEVIDGELYLMSRPRAGHSSVANSLSYELVGPFNRGRGGPGGWVFLGEPELHFGEDIVVPDLAGWRRDRLPPIEDDQAFIAIPPDWLNEVLSRSTEKHDRYRKLRVYAAAGVSHVWLIHPVRRTLEVLRLHGDKWLTIGTFADEERVRAEPFEAIELSLTELWRDLTLHANEEAAEYTYQVG